MRLRIALLFASAGVLAACSDPPAGGPGAARLERLRLQARVAEIHAQEMPLETRTAMFEQAISDAEARTKRIRDLSAQVAAASGKAE